MVCRCRRDSNDHRGQPRRHSSPDSVRECLQTPVKGEKSSERGGQDSGYDSGCRYSSSPDRSCTRDGSHDVGETDVPLEALRERSSRDVNSQAAQQEDVPAPLSVEPPAASSPKPPEACQASPPGPESPATPPAPRRSSPPPSSALKVEANSETTPSPSTTRRRRRRRRRRRQDAAGPERGHQDDRRGCQDARQGHRDARRGRQDTAGHPRHRHWPPACRTGPPYGLGSMLPMSAPLHPCVPAFSWPQGVMYIAMRPGEPLTPTYLLPVAPRLPHPQRRHQRAARPDSRHRGRGTSSSQDVRQQECYRGRHSPQRVSSEVEC